MANFLANRVHVDTSSSGTADLVLGAAISAAYQSFASAGVPNGATFPYTAYTGTQWECGTGAYLSGTTTLDRTAANVVAGTAGAGALTDFSSNPRVFIGPLAETFVLATGGGKQAVPIPAGGMTPSTTSGAAAGSVETAANKNMLITLDFDATASESVQFAWPMPSSWNEGTVTFQPIWSHAATTTNFGVVWELSAVAISDDDAGDAAFGSGQTSTDTGGTTNDVYIGPESAAITVAGTPTAGDFVMFKVARLPTNGSDTLAVDARLHSIRLFMTTDAAVDV